MSVLPTPACAELRCFVFLSFFFFILKPDRLSSQLQGCIAAGTPSFSWLPELLLLSPGFGFSMAHGNPASSVYAAQKKDLLVELWPGSPRSQARGLGGQGDAGEDPGWDGLKECQGSGQEKLGIRSIQCPLVFPRAHPVRAAPGD